MKHQGLEEKTGVLLILVYEHNLSITIIALQSPEVCFMKGCN